LFSLVKLVFFECEHPVIDKPMVITEPAVVSARLLGLGWKLYPSNMPGKLNEDITGFMQSFVSRAKIEQAKERLDLLACRVVGRLLLSLSLRNVTLCKRHKVSELVVGYGLKPPDPLQPSTTHRFHECTAIPFGFAEL